MVDLLRLIKKYSLVKRTDDYENEIEILFAYNVKLDQPDTNPKCICSACRRKMDCCKVALKNGSNVATNRSIYVYDRHNADNCFVCLHTVPVVQFLSIF